jgi:outer membrane murein-binding lipoprotein Lpp
MRFKKLITPLLITVIICATLALGYQQDPLRRGLTNPFSGAEQTQKKDDKSAEVKDLYSRITNLESKVSLLEKRILPNRLQNTSSGAGQTLTKDDQYAEVKDLYSRITNLESKVSSLEKRILPNPRLPNPFSGAGQTLKKDEELYSRITNLESKVSSLEKRIEDLQKPRVLERTFGVESHSGQPLIWR